MAHIRQSRPHSDLGFQVNDIKIFEVAPSSLGSGQPDPCAAYAAYGLMHLRPDPCVPLFVCSQIRVWSDSYVS